MASFSSHTLSTAVSSGSAAAPPVLASSPTPPPPFCPSCCGAGGQQDKRLIDSDQPLKQSSPLISIRQNCLFFFFFLPSPSHEQGPAYQADFCPSVPSEGPCPQAQTGPSITFPSFMLLHFLFFIPESPLAFAVSLGSLRLK